MSTTCIDMGGGTSDISIWQNDKLLHQCSVQLAGRDLFSQFVEMNPKFLKIFDINGRILISKEVTPHSSINISNYSKGIYILNFEDINNINNYSQKFIKN